MKLTTHDPSADRAAPPSPCPMSAGPAPEDKVVNVYNWTDYIGETTIEDFQKATGIEVIYDTYDSTEAMEAKMLAGSTGYDVVDPGRSTLPRFIERSFRKLDKSKLPNWQQSRSRDPEGHRGLGSGQRIWRALYVGHGRHHLQCRHGQGTPARCADLNSLDLLFKPENAAKLADCGISILESPGDVIPMVLPYLGKDPNTTNPEDFRGGRRGLQADPPIYQDLRQLELSERHSQQGTVRHQQLVGRLCHRQGARRGSRRRDQSRLSRARDRLARLVRFWCIPADAPQPRMPTFINYMLEPEVIAKCTNFTNYANANRRPTSSSTRRCSKIRRSFRRRIMKRLWTQKTLTQDLNGLRTRPGARSRQAQNREDTKPGSNRCRVFQFSEVAGGTIIMGVRRNPTGSSPPVARPRRQALHPHRTRHQAVRRLHRRQRCQLDIYKGELFALLGGSGCGKTTLLRMLAGFEQPTAGRVFIDGQDMTGVPPYERPVNMMFQSYALFPHMTVEKNVGYGLKHETMTDAQRKDRVKEMLDLVQLTPLAGRKPHQLSGGQRQRVALARALAKQPKLLLLDEPLGALDKKLREQTQFEIMNIQEKTGITFVVVTHDQEEAMTLATRIAVMDKGEIRQTGTPTEIYEFPQTRFVADFIGSINQFEGTVKSCQDGKASPSPVPAGAAITWPIASGDSPRAPRSRSRCGRRRSRSSASKPAKGRQCRRRQGHRSRLFRQGLALPREARLRRRWCASTASTSGAPARASASRCGKTRSGSPSSPPPPSC